MLYCYQADGAECNINKKSMTTASEVPLKNALVESLKFNTPIVNDQLRRGRFDICIGATRIARQVCIVSKEKKDLPKEIKNRYDAGLFWTFQDESGNKIYADFAVTHIKLK